MVQQSLFQIISVSPRDRGREEKEDRIDKIENPPYHNTVLDYLMLGPVAELQISPILGGEKSAFLFSPQRLMFGSH